MFEIQTRNEPSILSLVLQVLGCWIGSTLFAFVFGHWPLWLGEHGWFGRALEGPGIVVLAVLPAFFIGRATHHNSPDAAELGQWVWAVPGTFLFAGLAGATVRSTLGQELVELFFPVGGGESTLAALLFTYPTFGCFGYSLGIWYERRRETKSANHGDERGASADGQGNGRPN